MDTKKLRQKILDLAIRGKLVPQDPNDEPASVLLERIRTEKERLIKEGKIKRSKKTATNEEIEPPFEIPESWEWVKLDDLAFYKKGPFGSSLTKSMFVPDTPDAFKVYEQKNAINKDASLGYYFIDSAKYEELKGFAVSPSDIIVSCAGTIGETYVLPRNIREGIINQALMLIRLYDIEITDFYLLYFDFILKNEAAKESKGTAIKNIPPFDVLKNFLIPIPPLAEQKRIANEIERWFTLIDELESNEGDLLKAIDKAKSQILDLAIHGKLVPQHPNDEPAIELLKRINPKFEPCDNEQYTDQLPKGWVNAKLEDICQVVMGSSPSGENLNIIKDGVEFHQGKLNFTDLYVDTSDTYTTFVTKLAPENSILLCVRAPVGIVNITPRPICIGRGLCSLTPKGETNLMFLFYALHTLQSYYEDNATGTTFKAIGGDTVRQSIIPVPPADEQIRIVAKIEELFAVLDSIKDSL